MGVKNLSKLLKENNVIPEKTDLKDLKNKIFAIDTSLYMHRFNSGYAYKTPIEGFIWQIMTLLEHNITPVYIFDGAPPMEKLEELKERKERNNKLKEQYIKSIENTDDIIEKINLEKKLDKLLGVTKDKFDELKMILDCFNIKYIISNEEADDLCKYLNKYNLVDFSVSEDKDFLVNNKYTISKLDLFRGTCDIWDRNEILKGLNISLDSFIDLCIILGCDYCKKTIPRVGYKTGYKLILKYGNIEKIIENEKKYDTSNFNYIIARERLKNEFDYNYSNKYDFYIKNFDKNKITDLLKKYKLFEKFEKRLIFFDNYLKNINNTLVNYLQ